jgi:putative FmdB family regulatory protein
MPAYDYTCAACGRRFEVIHGVHAEGPTSCPLCGKGPVRKAITAAAVHYRGSGWAKKERRTPVKTGASKSSDEASGDGGSSSDGDTKPEATTKADKGDGGSSSDGDTKPEATTKADRGDGAAKPKTGAAETGSSSKGG